MAPHTIRRILMPLAAAAALTGCDTTDAPTLGPDAYLQRMASCDDVQDRLEDVILEQIVEGRYGWGWGGFLEDDAVDAPAADNDAGGGSRGTDEPTDFTGTNNQEEGVDELDLVKTNGTHMFIAEDRGLHIVDSWPAEEAHKLASIDLEGWAQGLFLVDDQVVVFQSVSTELDVDGGKPGEREWWSGTRVTFVDVSDPSDPTVEREIDIEGYVADARMVDGQVYAVMNQYFDIPWEVWEKVYEMEDQLPDWPDDPTEEELEARKDAARKILRPVVREVVQGLDLDDVLPGWRPEAGGELESMFACTDIYAPSALSPLSMLAVSRIDPKQRTLEATGLLANGWTVYASADNLYVAQSSRWWWGWDEETVSHIHKFALEGDSEPAYLASGAVEGWLYDQFAMSEYDGHLRVVSTDFRQWWGFQPDEEVPEPANHVTVLKDDGKGELEAVGHVGGIAPNEAIQSARMMGDKGYMVTFEQVDPLFTLDLSKPTDPRVVGELKIPGFSSYLHPVGDDHLLAVGMSGTWDGQITGMAINLFDVSDMADPKLVQSHEVGGDQGWSWSEALWDHHAFTYHRDTLTIPAMLEHYDEQAQRWDGFSGTISFHATPEDGISEIGRVDHRDLVLDSECLYDRWYDWGEESVCSWDYGYWYARVRRSVYIEDNLFTISDYGVKVNDLTDPSIELTDVLFYPAD